MRTSVKLAFALIVSIVLIASLFAYFQVRTEKQRMRVDMEKRAEMLAASMEESFEVHLERGLVPPRGRRASLSRA